MVCEVGMPQKVITILPCFLYVIFSSAYVNASDLILSNVWLNGIDRNRETVVFEENKQLYTECQVLQQLKIKIEKFQLHPTQKNFCMVSVTPDSAELDPLLQSIKLVLPSEYLQSDEITTDQMKMPHAATLGGFVNYETSYARFADSHEAAVLTEFGVFKDFWLLNHAMIYRNNNNNDDEGIYDASEQQPIANFIRLNTSLEWEFPERYSRLILGDTTTISNPFVSALRYGGISFGSNFTERPDFIYWNAPSLTGSAALPSTVDLYLNGVSIYQQRVSQGDYVLQTGANIQQSGDAQIVVEDVLGNRSVQSLPLFINNRLLKPELMEYNVSLGKLRYNYDTQSDDYREFFSNAYLRRGFSQSTTLGLNAAYSKDVQNIGLMWTQGLSHWALLDMYFGASHLNGDEGYSVGTSLSRTLKNMSFGVNAQYASEEYHTLAYLDGSRFPEYDLLFYFSAFDLKYINNLNINYVVRHYQTSEDEFGRDSDLLNIGISKNITANLNANLSYTHDFVDSNESAFYLALSYNFGGGKSLYASHSTDQQSRLQFVHNNVAETGLDYSVAANRREGEMSYSAFANYRTDYGDLNLQHTQASDYENSRFGYRGAVVWLDGKTALTRAVDNAFALVNVSGYPDVEVYRSLSPMGRTDQQGQLFVHNLIPYINYQLSFDQDQLSMDDQIDQSDQSIVTLNKRGYLIDFPIIHTRLIVVKLRNAQGQLLSRASEVYLNGQQDEYFPVDVDGNVYLYGLRPMQYQLDVRLSGGNHCQTSLNLMSKDFEQITAPIELICQ